jgi:hypothetical protein
VRWQSGWKQEAIVSDPKNIDYYARREKSERDLAARTADPHIARIHSELADRYAHHVLSHQRPPLE